jgi:hypothetical protein
MKLAGNLLDSETCLARNADHEIQNSKIQAADA